MNAPNAAASMPAMSLAGSPTAAYAAGVARGEWSDDRAQHPALRELDRIHAALLDPPKRGPSTWLRTGQLVRP